MGFAGVGICPEQVRPGLPRVRAQPCVLPAGHRESLCSARGKAPLCHRPALARAQGPQGRAGSGAALSHTAPRGCYPLTLPQIPWGP